jgi:high affinity Mn2+ porin
MHRSINTRSRSTLLVAVHVLAWLLWAAAGTAAHAQSGYAADSSMSGPAADSTSTSPTAPQTVPAPGPASYDPMLLGAQYTFILQHQSALQAPYSGPLSLDPRGDTQLTNTVGAYTGWAPVAWDQLYLDVEKFMGAGDSSSTGLGGLTNGDVVREGASGVRKVVYIARLYTRFMLPLGSAVTSVDRYQDQIPGNEAATRLELKVGRMALPDDFDQNRYAGSARTEFLNWSLWDNTAWDYAANTRGYTDGVVLGYISPRWSLKYGVYRMPEMANGQTLVNSLLRASGQNLQLTLSSFASGTIVRLLAYLNTASMGNYAQALAIAADEHTRPDIAATDTPGRQKYGYGVNLEQPLADEGDTGAFLRWGWNDGKTESFAFTEVDRVLSGGLQISGQRWRQPDAQLGIGLVGEGLAARHRDYLAAGGCGFLLCDGRLNYGYEQIAELYYRLQRIWPEQPGPVRWQIGPDVQFIRNPGFNRDRGPVSFWAIRLHVEY